MNRLFKKIISVYYYIGVNVIEFIINRLKLYKLKKKIVSDKKLKK